MFRHKHDKAEAKVEKPAPTHGAKKSSITQFMSIFTKKQSNLSEEKKKADGAAKRDMSGMKEVSQADFEISNPVSGAPPTPNANHLSKKPSIQISERDESGSVNPSATTPKSGDTTPLKSMNSFSSTSSRKIPSVSLDTSGLPPALQNRDQHIPDRPPAMSIGSSLIDRYWHLGDVLEDRNVVLSWRQRALMALDLAKSLKKLHQGGVAHGRILVDTVLFDQDCRLKLQDTGSIHKTTDGTHMQRDVLCFGAILVQLALHQALDLGGSKPRRSINLDAPPPTDVTEGVPDENFANLKNIFSKTILGEDVTDLADSWEFGEALSAEVRALVGFHPSADETVPNDAISSLEELAVQCCSAIAMNRPEADAVEDWLMAIVDMVRGPNITFDDKQARDKVIWALQSNENEILGDVQLAEDSEAVTGKSAKTLDEVDKKDDDDDEKKEHGYETDDSFMPPNAQLQTRRPSRLSMFIEEADKVVPKVEASNALTSLAALKQDDDDKKTKKKRGGSRMSIKPTALNIEKFAGIHRRTSSSSGLVLTPAQCRSRFDKQARLTREEVLTLLSKAEEVLRAEPNLPVVQAPVTVVGDIHGQYFDLANMIDLAGPAGATKYLFLGDYVDRGDWSCEVLFYILSMKCAYPQMVTMIRGNHECDAVSSYFGFKEEVEGKYGRPIFYRCLALFQCMPVGAVLDTGGAGRFLCVHGGISPHVTSLEQFETVNRFQEPGMNGFLCDVLWSDPIKDDFDDGLHGKSLGDFLSIDFVSNPARGCSFRYGYSAIVKFLATNRLVAIIRAHEVMQEGFRYHFQTITGGGKGQARIMPPVITVFSAPNYLGTYGNRGAFLKVSSAKDRGAQGGGFKPIDLLEPVPFTAVPHPQPIILESETQQQRTTIEQACPYMPTTFDSFVARALEFALGEDADDEELLSNTFPDSIQEEKSIFDMETVTKAPGMEHRRKESLEREANELRQGLVEKFKVEMQGADLLKSGLLSTPNRRLSLVELQKKKGVSSLIAQFSKAAAADGINEMHPSLVQEKMTQAKKKLDSAPIPVAPTSPRHADESAIMGGTGRRTVVANKKPVVLDEGGRKSVVTKKSNPAIRSSVVNDKARAAQAASTGTSSKNSTPQKSVGPLEVEVDFTEQEIVALQMLYLMIDRDNVGTIKSKELSHWSAADGATISASDAELCIEALDLDEDGGVGFGDYLAFAARLKLKFEKGSKPSENMPSF